MHNACDQMCFCMVSQVIPLNYMTYNKLATERYRLIKFECKRGGDRVSLPPLKKQEWVVIYLIQRISRQLSKKW